VSLFGRYRTTFYRLLLLAVFIAIGLFVVDNLEQLRSNPIQFKWRFVLIGLALTMLGHLCSYAIWMRIATSFDMHTPWGHAGKAWFLSRLGRYIPGKISILLIRFRSYDSHSKTKVGAATIIEAYTSICAASILLLLLALTYAGSTGPPAIFAAVIVIALLALTHPGVARFMLILAGKLLPISTLHSLPRQRETFGFSLAQLLTMMLHGGALFMVFNAVGHADPASYLLITATFFVAGLVGMMAVFAPSGIGVREAALLAMLAHHLDPTTLFAGAILIRLVGITSEILLSSFFIAYERARGDAPGSPTI
jgi:glycosyltransferase 2 family protein